MITITITNTTTATTPVTTTTAIALAGVGTTSIVLATSTSTSSGTRHRAPANYELGAILPAHVGTIRIEFSFFFESGCASPSISIMVHSGQKPTCRAFPDITHIWDSVASGWFTDMCEHCMLDCECVEFVAIWHRSRCFPCVFALDHNL